jgi:two-component system sensor histidine kinase UhpB
MWNSRPPVSTPNDISRASTSSRLLAAQTLERVVSRPEVAVQEVARRPPEAHRRGVSVLWRVFAATAFVWVVAFLLLVLSPVTVHAKIRLSELLILSGGLVVMLAADLLLLRRELGPLRRLAAFMGAVDPMRPGRRAARPTAAGREVLTIGYAFNDMLDRLETERRDSARLALAAQEHERLRVARELHDEIGQTLTAVALRAERAAGQSDPQPEVLTEIAETLQRSLEDVRRIARELRPEALDDLGIVNALIAHCSRVRQQSGLAVRREFGGQFPKLTAEVELVAYRVAQEALTNAMRHSQASHVDVSLTPRPGGVVLTVRDDGCGLPEALGKTSGLAGMRERAMLIGADLTITSVAGGGVEVRLDVDCETEHRS